jgi:GNAT superfamily N-acetyltransferase
MRDLARVLDDAARGLFPPADGAIELFPRPEPPAVRAAVFSFTAHLVVAADVDEAALRDVAKPDDFVSWSRVAPWLRAREALTGDVLLAAVADGRPPSLTLDADGDFAHPRVERASRYRDGVRVFVTRARDGVLVLGRGVAGRHELAFEVDPPARNAGLGRALVSCALALVPPGEVVWAQVHPANAASLRAVLDAGLRPVGYEQLIV